MFRATITIESMEAHEPPALEGLTLTALGTYLQAPSFTAHKKADLLRRLADLLHGQTSTIFKAQEIGGEKWSYLVNGPGHFLVRGQGDTVDTFKEASERLTFFAKVGYAPAHSLHIQQAFSVSGIVPVTLTSPLILSQDSTYQYHIDGQHCILIAMKEGQIELASATQRVLVKEDLFWAFVFGGSDPLAEISVAHTAALLGLSSLTIGRRAGEGKLPAVRPQSRHPGIRRSGLEEYIAYREAFPQGCINHSRWIAWRADWRERYKATHPTTGSYDTQSVPDLQEVS